MDLKSSIIQGMQTPIPVQQVPEDLVPYLQSLQALKQHESKYKQLDRVGKLSKKQEEKMRKEIEKSKYEYYEGEDKTSSYSPFRKALGIKLAQDPTTPLEQIQPNLPDKPVLDTSEVPPPVQAPTFAQVDKRNLKPTREDYQAGQQYALDQDPRLRTALQRTGGNLNRMDRAELGFLSRQEADRLAKKREQRRVSDTNRQLRTEYDVATRDRDAKLQRAMLDYANKARERAEAEKGFLANRDFNLGFKTRAQAEQAEKDYDKQLAVQDAYSRDQKELARQDAETKARQAAEQRATELLAKKKEMDARARQEAETRATELLAKKKEMDAEKQRRLAEQEARKKQQQAQQEARTKKRQDLRSSYKDKSYEELTQLVPEFSKRMVQIGKQYGPDSPQMQELSEDFKDLQDAIPGALFFKETDKSLRDSASQARMDRDTVTRENQLSRGLRSIPDSGLLTMLGQDDIYNTRSNIYNSAIQRAFRPESELTVDQLEQLRKSKPNNQNIQFSVKQKLQDLDAAKARGIELGTKDFDAISKQYNNVFGDELDALIRDKSQEVDDYLAAGFDQSLSPEDQAELGEARGLLKSLEEYRQDPRVKAEEEDALQGAADFKSVEYYGKRQDEREEKARQSRDKQDALEESRQTARDKQEEDQVQFIEDFTQNNPDSTLFDTITNEGFQANSEFGQAVLKRALRDDSELTINQLSNFESFLKDSPSDVYTRDVINSRLKELQEARNVGMDEGLQAEGGMGIDTLSTSSSNEITDLIAAYTTHIEQLEEEGYDQSLSRDKQLQYGRALGSLRQLSTLRDAREAREDFEYAMDSMQEEDDARQAREDFEYAMDSMQEEDIRAKERAAQARFTQRFRDQNDEVFKRTSKELEALREQYKNNPYIDSAIDAVLPETRAREAKELGRMGSTMDYGNMIRGTVDQAGRNVDPRSFKRRENTLYSREAEVPEPSYSQYFSDRFQDLKDYGSELVTDASRLGTRLLRPITVGAQDLASDAIQNFDFVRNMVGDASAEELNRELYYATGDESYLDRAGISADEKAQFLEESIDDQINYHLDQQMAQYDYERPPPEKGTPEYDMYIEDRNKFRDESLANLEDYYGIEGNQLGTESIRTDSPYRDALNYVSDMFSDPRKYLNRASAGAKETFDDYVTSIPTSSDEVYNQLDPNNPLRQFFEPENLRDPIKDVTAIEQAMRTDPEVKQGIESLYPFTNLQELPKQIASDIGPNATPEARARGLSALTILENQLVRTDSEGNEYFGKLDDEDGVSQGYRGINDLTDEQRKAFRAGDDLFRNTLADINKNTSFGPNNQTMFAYASNINNLSNQLDSLDPNSPQYKQLETQLVSQIETLSPEQARQLFETMEVVRRTAAREQQPKAVDANVKDQQSLLRYFYK